MPHVSFTSPQRVGILTKGNKKHNTHEEENGTKAREKNDKEIRKQVAAAEASEPLIEWFMWLSLIHFS